MYDTQKNGFTLIEVLIALAIISIALTALLLTTAETVRSTHRLRQKTLAHLVTTQGLTEIQLGLVPLEQYQSITQPITLFNQQWFWHAKSTPTKFNQVERITVTASVKQNGPFTEPLIGFRRLP
ncbi:MAG: type II secretion system minor pseudopilin GspI [Legionella sp.]|nr:type II secretion system minor pseudopilin GspI [Legionella sp.]